MTDSSALLESVLTSLGHPFCRCTFGTDGQGDVVLISPDRAFSEAFGQTQLPETIALKDLIGEEDAQALQRCGAETPPRARLVTVPNRQEQVPLLFHPLPGGTEGILVVETPSALSSEQRQLMSPAFASVQDATPDGFMVFRSIRDEEGQIVDFEWVYSNRAGARIIKREPEDLVGRRLLEEMPNHIESGLFAAYARVVETGARSTAEFPYKEDNIDGWFRNTVIKSGDGFAVTFADITTAKRYEFELISSERRLRTIFDGILAFVGLTSTDGTVLEANTPALAIAQLERGDVIGQKLWETPWFSYREDVSAQIKDAVTRAAAGEVVRFDTEARIAEEEIIALDFQLAPGLGADGRVSELIPSAIDITDRRRADEQREILVREMAHRIKNSLAMIGALANNTIRSATSLEQFRDVFTGRLNAVSMAHSLVVNSPDGPVQLHDLIKEQIQPYTDGNATCLEIEGPSLSLAPELAQNFGLVLHELTTNAIKYGALSVPSGVVSVAWQRTEDSPADTAVELVWEERGGPPVTPPTRNGFGSRLVSTSVRTSMGGEAVLDFPPEGFRATIKFPLQDALA